MEFRTIGNAVNGVNEWTFGDIEDSGVIAVTLLE